MIRRLLQLIALRARVALLEADVARLTRQRDAAIDEADAMGTCDPWPADQADRLRHLQERLVHVVGPSSVYLQDFAELMRRGGLE